MNERFIYELINKLAMWYKLTQALQSAHTVHLSTSDWSCYSEFVSESWFRHSEFISESYNLNQPRHSEDVSESCFCHSEFISES
ncbi:hypothetical protein BET10_04785 [Pseudoalteromonas amylolytica]|uniref:Uncharacterized protein n=1 Tax=Pseudoalteromonas amylolytica TaxID=1859457 RepID=A0A1S1MZG2_9GAMM|nr:hypothetical protein BFC16_03110 [Pseudoalteromonas sp. JW3]OHU92771.1 hypothetical protein BET10_04785 [Pseudoalteromonas amylolytica]